MFQKTMVRGLMAMASQTKIISLALLLTACIVTHGLGDTITLTTPGSGSLTVPTGYEWTDVAVDCWGGGGEGGAMGLYSGGGGGGGACAVGAFASLTAGTYYYSIGSGGTISGGAGGNTSWNSNAIEAGGGGGGGVAQR